MTDIKKNLDKITAEKNSVAVSCGRQPEDVLLLAVTKLHSAEEINTAIEWGITDIGENKVQELLLKYESVKPVRWHLIGHLQTNKVKFIVDKVCMIHSVDSLHLAEEINKRSGAAGKIMDILIQVNAAGEKSKFGVAPEEAESLIKEIRENCPYVRVRGLMHIAPFADDPEDVRVYFRQLKLLFDSIRKNNNYEYFDCLSMGMSGDYKVAIEEGSTIIRVGTSIFGERDYSL